MRLWRAHDGVLHLVAGPPLPEDESPPPLPAAGRPPEGHLCELPGASDYYIHFTRTGGAEALTGLVAHVVGGEGDLLKVTEELLHRDEEIDLLYTIADVLGRTIGLAEAASVIVREVSAVVGARRASILVHDPVRDVLTPVAGWGVDVSDFPAVATGDDASVAAKVFRECQAILEDTDADTRRFQIGAGRAYRGRAFLSVPIVYRDSAGAPRPVGVINLTDRMGEDAFHSAHEKLVTAIAHQIGAAIENARLVDLDREQQRMRRELELAEDLQRRLLPSPDLLGEGVEVAARCQQAEGVGGDFYQFVPLSDGQTGVMLGDVSSHGFGAALIMALVLSASGIHAASGELPEVALDRLLASVRSKLRETEMHLAVFYGVADAKHGRLRYANAGHPHAFRVPCDGTPERLSATAPPLGLVEGVETCGAEAPWRAGEDILVLISDGIIEATNAAGEPFGEERVLSAVAAARNEPAKAIVDAVFKEVARFGGRPSDDRTMVVLKA